MNEQESGPALTTGEHRVNFDGFVCVIENLFTKAYCDFVISQFEAADSLGCTFNRNASKEGGTTKKNDVSYWSGDYLDPKTSTVNMNGLNSVIATAWLQAHENIIKPEYYGKFDALNDIGSHGILGTKVQRTMIGGGYHIWHHETMDRAHSGRILATITYLNDVDEGGETEFLYQSKRYKPKAGTVLVFPCDFTHTHRGNPPLSNTKYILTNWIEF